MTKWTKNVNIKNKKRIENQLSLARKKMSIFVFFFNSVIQFPINDDNFYLEFVIEGDESATVLILVSVDMHLKSSIILRFLRSAPSAIDPV